MVATGGTHNTDEGQTKASNPMCMGCVVWCCAVLCGVVETRRSDTEHKQH